MPGATMPHCLISATKPHRYLLLLLTFISVSATAAENRVIAVGWFNWNISFIYVCLVFVLHMLLEYFEFRWA